MSVETEFYGRSRFPKKSQDDAQTKITLKVEVAKEGEKQEETPKQSRWNAIFHALFPSLFVLLVYGHFSSFIH